MASYSLLNVTPPTGPDYHEYKGMDMPNIPETQADFLRNWQR